MARVTRVHIAWIALVLVEVLATAVFFPAASWVEKEGVVVPAELGGDGNATATFRCGPLSYCVSDVSPSGALDAPAADVEFGSFCATRYGKHFLDIPVRSWVAAAVFVFAGGLVWVGVLAGAFVSLCARTTARTASSWAAFGTLLTVIGIFLVADGFKDTAPDGAKTALAQDVCHVCGGATSFDIGNCGVSWALAAAAGCTLSQIPVIALGYYAWPHSYADSGASSAKVYPA